MARTARGVALAGRRERLLEDGGEGGAGVLDVGVDAAAGEGLLADVAAGEVEAAVDALGMAFGGEDGFDLLGEEFAEDDLLGEVLGADDDARGARRGAGGEKQQQYRSAGVHHPPPPDRMLGRSALFGVVYEYCVAPGS